MSRGCCECGRTFERMVKSGGTTYCQSCYKYFVLEDKERYDVSPYGDISYNDEGHPICHICGMAHSKLMTHVRYYHNMKAYEYKKKFGLETTKSIMSEKSKSIARERNKEHYDKVVLENLIEKGVDTRYEKGSKGRTKDQLSVQTLRKLHTHFNRIRKGL